VSVHDTKLIAAAVERELIEAWRAVANAKLEEFRRQAWRLAVLTREGLVPKAANRFGAFPPWDYKNLRPAAPSESTLRWVKSRQIAYAKSRAVA
jgi:hypothetical protein